MPLLAKITEEYQGELLLAKVNCDLEQDIVARFGIRSLPTVVARSSNEIYIGTREGVVRAWAIRKKPEAEQWDGRLIKEMRGTPAKPNPNRSGNTIPIAVSVDRPSEEEAEERRDTRTEGKPRFIYTPKQNARKGRFGRRVSSRRLCTKIYYID